MAIVAIGIPAGMSSRVTPRAKAQSRTGNPLVRPTLGSSNPFVLGASQCWKSKARTSRLQELFQQADYERQIDL
jgi:hypothetical protein